MLNPPFGHARPQKLAVIRKPKGSQGLLKFLPVCVILQDGLGRYFQDLVFVAKMLEDYCIQSVDKDLPT